MKFPPTTNISAQDFEKQVMATTERKEESKEELELII